MAWKNVQYENGKMRTSQGGSGGSTVTITPTLSTGTKIADFEIDGESGALYAPQGGGGGASSLTDLDDVNINSAVNKDILEFDSSSQKWVNTPNPMLINSNYYTNPQLVGTWIDGKPLYEFTLVANYSNSADIYMPSYVTQDWARIFMVEAYIYDSGNHGDVPVMRDINAFVDSSNYGRANMQYTTSNNIRVYVQNTLDNSKYVSYGSDIKYVFVIRYTKNTDTILNNYSMLPVRYSLSERLVGTWIDGKPLYERTYTVNMPNMTDYAVSGSQITGKIYLDNISYGRVFMTTGFVHTKVRERFIQCGPLNYPQGSNRTSANIQYNSNNQRFFLDFFDNYSQWSTYASDLWITFTVRYTKTTD